MFLKNRNINSKIKRSKVTDYAALKIKNSKGIFEVKSVKLLLALSILIKFRTVAKVSCNF